MDVIHKLVLAGEAQLGAYMIQNPTGREQSPAGETGTPIDKPGEWKACTCRLSPRNCFTRSTCGHRDARRDSEIAYDRRSHVAGYLSHAAPAFWIMCASNLHGVTCDVGDDVAANLALFSTDLVERKGQAA